MTTPLPAHVREGDVLSATWLNQAVDFMKELADKGNSASSSGNSSEMSASLSASSLGHDTKARPYEDEGVRVFYHRDFELRLKPDDEEGRTVQMRCGRIVDYRGVAMGILDKKPANGGSAESSGETGADGWISIGAAANGVAVYVVIKQTPSGEIKEVTISDKPVEEVPWVPVDIPTLGTWSADPPTGSGSQEPGTEGVVCVFIGRVRSEPVDDETRFYIEQHHLGPIELQTVNVAKVEPQLSDDETVPQPVGLFRERRNNAFFFKSLQAKEGITLTDGTNISVGLERANFSHAVTKDGSGDGSGSREVPSSTQKLGGVDSIHHDKAAAAPFISQGDIRLAVADSIREVLGSIKNVVVDYVPQSALPMLGSVEASSLNYIRSGELHLSVPFSDKTPIVPPTPPDPIPPGGSGSGSDGGSDDGCSCPTYIFDPAYFVVTDSGKSRMVSLNTAAIANLVQECADEIEVEVSVTGLSETTEHGQLHVTTEGRGPVDDLEVESTVSYY